MRASRLVAVLLHVQRSGRATAPELAAALEVSVRTIYRDVAALQEAGVPLWTEPGPSGGVRLVEGWRFPLDGLSADETAALVLGAGPAGAAELGLGTVLAAAQSKVLSALPAELRSRATRMQERFHLDAPGWFAREEPAPHLATVAEAVWSGVRLDIGYRTGDRLVRRRLDPLGLVLKAGTWYLVAAHRGEPRTYRVSRVTAAERRPEPVTRPAGWHLAGFWERSAADFDRAILRLPCRLRLDRVALRRLPAAVPGPSTAAAVAGATPPDDEGRCCVDLAVESVAVAVSQLASLGGVVEVLEPPSLRAALAAHGAGLAAANAPPAGSTGAREDARDAQGSRTGPASRTAMVPSGSTS